MRALSVRRLWPVVVLAGVVLSVATPAHAETAETITVAWLMPAGTDGDTRFVDRFSQTLHGTSATSIPPLDCGRTYQFDSYRYDTAEDRERVDALIAGDWLGIVRGHPIDAGLHVQDGIGPDGWWFESGPTCDVLPPTGATPGPAIAAALLLIGAGAAGIRYRRKAKP